jgi:hypothetical protein
MGKVKVLIGEKADGTELEFPEEYEMTIQDVAGIDIETTPPAVGDVLVWNGDAWVPEEPSTAAGGGCFVNVILTDELGLIFNEELELVQHEG